MNEAEIEAAFTKADLLRTMNRVFCKCPTLKRIIYDGEIDLKDLKALHETHPDIETITLEELKQMGIDHPVEVVPPDSFRAHQTPKEVCQGTHGVVGKEDVNIPLQDFQELLVDNLLPQHELAHKLAEPGVARGQATFVATHIAPAVLDSPVDRLVVLIQMDARKDHRVGHE